jgi:TolB-like protein/class 3 adenylate cyclase
MIDPQKSKRRLAAIMFADIVGYTALMQADEDGAKRLRDKHRLVIEDRVRAHSGEIINYYGDGAVCLFNSAREAVLGAREIQTSLIEEPRVPHRIGIHIGDIVQEESGIYGDGVNIASRIESLAVPGSVLFSDKVFYELENHPSIATRSLGAFRLKNVKRPVGVFALDHAGIVVPTADMVQSNVAQAQMKSIAIMPFVCFEQGDEGAYFADGLSEEIGIGLCKVDGLSMISRDATVAIRESPEGPVQKARQMGVTHLLEGSVRRASDKVRVAVKLVNTADGYLGWSETFNGSLERIFELQDEIARSVVSAMRVNFNLTVSEPIVEQHTANSEAHQLYLKGLHHWNKRNPDSVVKASELFGQALEADANYSSAQCALSYCYAFLGSCGVMPPTDAYAKSLNYAMQAIEVNPRNAEAHLAIANLKFYHYWDWKGTKASLDKAESLGLTSGDFYQSYGLFEAAMGNHHAGILKMQKALEHDPLSIPVMSMLGTLQLFNEEYDSAIAVFDEILELEPGFRSALLYKGIALACKGAFEDALIACKEYHHLVGNPQKGLHGLVLAYHALGEDGKCEEYVGRLNARLESEKSVAVKIDLAVVHAAMGNHDESIRFLNDVYDNRFSIACMGMIWVLRCPYFKDLWQTTGFKQLLDRMGLAA